MTLIIGSRWGTGLIQTSDRLTTIKDGHVWDPQANKTVVIAGPVGWAVLSYTGTAYVGGRPTDQWMAEVLSDRTAQSGPHGGYSTSFDSTLMPVLGSALKRLEVAIATDLLKEHTAVRRVGLEIRVEGFSARRKARFRPEIRLPFAVGYSRSGALGDRVVIDRGKRMWPWSSGACHAVIGREDLALSSGALDRYIDGWARLSPRTLDGFEELQARFIREVASKPAAGVGTNCMSVVGTMQGAIRCRYLPDTTIPQPGVAFSPWVIVPGILSPPQQMTGASLPSLHSGGIDVYLDCRPAFRPGPMSSGSQVRKGPPR